MTDPKPYVESVPAQPDPPPIELRYDPEQHRQYVRGLTDEELFAHYRSTLLTLRESHRRDKWLEELRLRRIQSVAIDQGRLDVCRKAYAALTAENQQVAEINRRFP